MDGATGSSNGSPHACSSAAGGAGSGAYSSTDSCAALLPSVTPARTGDTASELIKEPTPMDVCPFPPQTSQGACLNSLPLALLTCDVQSLLEGSALRRRLAETIARRRSLDDRIRSLRAELRFCEEGHASLMQEELLLSAEVAELESEGSPASSPKLREFKLDDSVSIGASTDLCDSQSDPAVQTESTSLNSTPRQAEDADCQGLARDDLADAREQEEGELSDLEGRLDSVGVARCRRCGLRLPLNQDVIDAHASQCYDQHRCTGRQLLCSLHVPAPPADEQHRTSAAPSSGTEGTPGNRANDAHQPPVLGPRQRACCAAWPFFLGPGVFAAVNHVPVRPGQP